MFGNAISTTDTRNGISVRITGWRFGDASNPVRLITGGETIAGGGTTGGIG